MVHNVVLGRCFSRTSANCLLRHLQWHVTPGALDQWTKYRKMISEDAAKHHQQSEQQQQQPQQRQHLQVPRQASSQVPPPNATADDALHLSRVKGAAASSSRGHNPLGPSQTKRQRTDPDMQFSKLTSPQQQQYHFQQVADESCNSGVQQGRATQSEDARDLNDTVGAIFVNAAGKYLLVGCTSNL